ncbi:phosphoribosylamine--glycine ligase [Thalassoporum mexicanum PCC 7367]|uniref:phosphoribosylamine--glycine ligase n=1 Tax=Thalassoporum mexicanum TaxID=3457544 RepID=UPI00029FBC0A|nr:phosphoribosylamine--glycine ligase [Pseudanabaena sp. PCC 7367]AFY70955.1 phosphoribosylamine--glycine ligase [Pseudanabaena sp. PCC 7367]
MKIIVIGSGGREHALAWQFAQSAQVKQIFCIPGNAGTATIEKCRNVALNQDDFEGILRFAQVQGVQLTVVGPEAPLADGVVDFFQAGEMPIFGPTKQGAQIEASKSWAKDLMVEAGIPTAASEVFTDPIAAREYVQAQGVPIVIKADGLASGKGVTVATTFAEANQAIDEALGGKFGDAGETLLIEECLQGQEASVLAITDGKTIRALLPAQDHKRIGVGDTGPNTGGMGAYAPAPIVTPEIQRKIQTQVLEPAIAALQKRKIDYCGCLYAGLMITPAGEPKVIEFNCRFGDPETQVILPLLETPLADLMLACIEKRLEQMPAIEWKDGAAVCVVLASGGYPGKYETGKPITGIGKAKEHGAIVFHAGTKLKTSTLVTAGGRVLGVTAIGESIQAAIDNAYVSLAYINFEGATYRHDIGHRAIAN